MTNETWIKFSDQLPPEGKVVDTKIDDEKGIRNEAKLKRVRNLMFHADGKMYVYYTPTTLETMTNPTQKAEELIREFCKFIGKRNYYIDEEGVWENAFANGKLLTFEEVAKKFAGATRQAEQGHDLTTQKVIRQKLHDYDLKCTELQQRIAELESNKGQADTEGKDYTEETLRELVRLFEDRSIYWLNQCQEWKRKAENLQVILEKQNGIIPPDTTPQSDKPEAEEGEDENKKKLSHE